MPSKKNTLRRKKLHNGVKKLHYGVKKVHTYKIYWIFNRYLLIIEQ